MKHTCFGLPSVVNIKSDACMGCSERMACAVAAEKALVSIQDKLDVREELNRIRHITVRAPVAPAVPTPSVVTTIAVPTQSVVPEKVKITLTEAHREKLSALPVKVQEKMRALIASGMLEKAAASLRRRENPFSRDKQPYLALAADKLITGGGFTKAELRQCFMATYEWKENTAFSRVSSTVGVFTALEIAVDMGDRVVVAPNLISKNA